MYRSFVLFFFLCSLAAFGQEVDIQHYKFELELTDRSDAISGKATITVRFPQGGSQWSLDLASVEGDKGMQCFGVQESGIAAPLRFLHREDRLIINLNQPARPGESHTYEIQYMGIPKDGLIIDQNKYKDRTFFADNWPNRAHQWIPCIDRPDDKASFEFLVTTPDQYQVISNGLKTEEKLLSDKRKLTHWSESTALPTKVMVIGVARFATKVFASSPQGLPVSAWVYPQDSAKAFYDYSLAPEILRFFSGYVAPYPYEKLANVQSKTIFGGMENASAIFYAEESVTGDRKWEDVFAHEIAHQWFGDMASEKSFAHLWLSEGFATYLTDIYWQNKYGDEAFRKRMTEEREKVIRFSRQSSHPVVDSTADLMSLLNPNSYEKGAWFLHMLRTEVGDTAFRRILQQYYARYKGGNAETRDFENVAESVSGKDLRAFFDQWLYRPGLPELSVAVKSEKDECKLTIMQNGTLYVLPLEIRITMGEGNVRTEKLMLTGKETTLKVKGKGPFRVELDPDVKLLFLKK